MARRQRAVVAFLVGAVAAGASLCDGACASATPASSPPPQGAYATRAATRTTVPAITRTAAPVVKLTATPAAVPTATPPAAAPTAAPVAAPTATSSATPTAAASAAPVATPPSGACPPGPTPLPHLGTTAPPPGARWGACRGADFPADYPPCNRGLECHSRRRSPAPPRCVALTNGPCGRLGEVCDSFSGNTRFVYPLVCADDSGGAQCDVSGVCPSGAGTCTAIRVGDRCNTSDGREACGDSALDLECVPRPAGAPPPAGVAWAASTPLVGPDGAPAADGVCALTMAVGSACTPQRPVYMFGGCERFPGQSDVRLGCVRGRCVPRAADFGPAPRRGDECDAHGGACADGTTCWAPPPLWGSTALGLCADLAGAAGDACDGAVGDGSPAPSSRLCDTAKGLVCRSGRCVVATTPAGAACDAEVGCAGGPTALTCAYPPSEPVLVERNPARLCLRVVPPGGGCNGTRVACGGGTTCSPGGTCEASGGGAAACGDGEPPCRPGLTCGPAGRCGPPPGRPVDGRPCALDAHCAAAGGSGGTVGEAYFCHPAPRVNYP